MSATQATVSWTASTDDRGVAGYRVLRDGVRLSNYPFVRAFIDSVDVLRGPGAALGVLAIIVVALGTYLSHVVVERTHSRFQPAAKESASS